MRFFMAKPMVFMADDKSGYIGLSIFNQDIKYHQSNG